MGSDRGLTDWSVSSYLNFKQSDIKTYNEKDVELIKAHSPPQSLIIIEIISLEMLIVTVRFLPVTEVIKSRETGQ